MRSPEPENQAESGIVKSADRVLDLFEVLSTQGGEMSHAEISQSLGIPKGSLSRLLKNLISRGYIDYEPATKGYHLGEALVRLARTTETKRNLVSLAQPLLLEITKQTRESCALNFLRGDLVEVIETVSSSQRLLSHLKAGDLAPLYAVSAGKAILAYLPEEQRQVYLQNVKFTAHTSRTITSTDVLIQQLEQAKSEGVAYSFEEFTPGIVGIAVAILSPTGLPVGALNVAMPAVRFDSETQDRVMKALKSAVAKLARGAS